MSDLKVVDVRGFSCPEPVLIVNGALQKDTSIKVLASEAHVVKNIVKLCHQLNKKVTTKEVGLEYELTIE